MQQISKRNEYEEGSRIKKASEDLKAAYPDVNWKEGKLLNRATKKDLEDWGKIL